MLGSRHIIHILWSKPELQQQKDKAGKERQHNVFIYCIKRTESTEVGIAATMV